MSYVVVDLETVPDVAVWAPPAKLPERLKVEKTPGKADVAFLSLVIETIGENKPIHPSDLEKAHEIAERAENADAMKALVDAGYKPEEEKKEFPPLYAHRPVAIGYLQLSSKFEVEAFGCAVDDGDERTLLTGWSQYITNVRPTLVTWNGRAFDLPVLNLRSIRRGVRQSWYNREVRNRYTEDGHIDVMDTLADFNPFNKLKLDAVAKTIGLPGKWGDMDGSKVADVYAAGGIDKIATYCKSDVVQTAFIFLRMQLVRGRLDLAEYQRVAGALYEGLKMNPEFVEFVSLCDEMNLLLQYGNELPF